MLRQGFTVVLLVGVLATMGIAQAQVCQPDRIPETTPDSQLRDNGDGTVTDNKTGLMWKQCSEGQSGSDCAGSATNFMWPQALQQAQTVNSNGFAGYHDWRVPSMRELAALLELSCISPAINLSRFPATPADGYYWSSSSVVESLNGGLVWYISFSEGATGFTIKDSDKPLRLVRSAQ